MVVKLQALFILILISFQLLIKGGSKVNFVIKIFIFGFVITANASIFAAAFPKLEQLIKMQQYQLAYNQALKILGENEGDPRFDYLYGLSASQTGHYNEAVFALDRVTVAARWGRGFRPPLRPAL